MTASAIIVAAGSGVRLGRPEPKAFVELGAFPLLYYSMRTLRDVADVIEIVVAIPPGHEAQARSAAARAGLRVAVKLVEGGAERQDSVRIALSLVSADSAVVVVHDAARPFAPASLFRACIEAAGRSGAAIAAIPVADTLKEAAGNLIRATRPRDGLYAAQTPQAFRRELLAAAHSNATAPPATDDAFLLEQLGNPIEIVPGSSLNFKITTPEDLRMAHALIASDRLLASQFE